MRRSGWVLTAIAALLLALSGCAEKQGSKGKTGPAGPAGTPAASVIQESLTFSVQSVSIPADGKPVVKFKLLDQDGLAYSKLTLGSNLKSANLRVTIAKLVAATSTQPSYWENYLNTTQKKDTSNSGVWTNPVVSGRCSVQPSQEGSTNFPAGTLTYDSATQAYTYTFKQSISSITAPTPDCTTPTGLAVTYSASATHRVGMELRNLTTSEGEVLGADVVYDFVPAGGTASTRAVVSTDTCNNACHGKLEAHGEGRFSVEYCVLCHNARLADPNGGNVYDMTAGNPLDFRVMVHRLHLGSNLPSKIDGGLSYKIWGYQDAAADFSFGTFPVMTISRSTSSSGTSQDWWYMRTTAAVGGGMFPDCTKCHTEDTSAPAQATNWKDNPTVQACTSCHDNVYFGAAAPTNAPTSSSYNTKMVQHTGGQYADNSSCGGCHASTSTTAATDTAHAYPVKIREQADRWNMAVTAVQYNSANGQLAVTYRIDDGTTVGVDYRTMNEFKPQAGGAAGALNIKVGWPAWEYVNDGQNSAAQLASAAAAGLAIGQGDPSAALSQSVLNQFTGTGSGATVTYTQAPAPDGACPGSTCTFTKTVYLPFTNVNAYGTTGNGNKVSLGVYLDGHPVGQVQAGIGNTGTTVGQHTAAEPRWRSAPSKSALSYWEVSTNAGALTAGTYLDPTVSTDASKIRRDVVETDRCQKCHTNVILHGANRSDDTQVCVTCHNANNTDVRGRADMADTKLEETVDLKVMIHGIHAGGRKSYTNASATFGGMRDYGIYVAGGDFASVAFPNRLDNCQACHKEGTYELPLNSDVNPVTWKSTPGAVNPYEAQRHTFDVTRVSNAAGNIQISTGSATAGTMQYVTAGVKVRLFANGDATLPTGITAGNTYYVVSSAIASGRNTFQLSLTSGGAAIAYTAGVGGCPGATGDTGLGCPGTQNLQSGSANTQYFTILPVDYADHSLQLNMSPIASACTGCHNTGLTKAHVISTGLGVLNFEADGTTPTAMNDATYNASINNGYGTGLEVCEICHGSGAIADVEKVHRIGGF